MENDLKSVCLFEQRSETSHRSITATIEGDGRLEVCEHLILLPSGADSEYLFTVSPEDVPAVIDALRGSGDDQSFDLLAAIEARFGGRRSADSDLAAFLAGAGIPTHPFTWISNAFFDDE